MFIVAQLPFADLRPMLDDQAGRLATPRWEDDALNTGFIRGFGSIVPRNSSSMGLPGEASFADANLAIRFVEKVFYKQKGWLRAIPIFPRFRRLYYDGRSSGRLELGFLSEDQQEMLALTTHDGLSLDTQNIARIILNNPVRVHSISGEIVETTIEKMGHAVARAYAVSTTANASVNRYPASDLTESLIVFGPASIHIRVSADHPVLQIRDKRTVGATPHGQLYITSAGRAGRSNITVQTSTNLHDDESPDERVVRVLFSHLNAFIFSTHRIAIASDSIEQRGSIKVLRSRVSEMIDRFGKTVALGEGDSSLAQGMHRFSAAYAGKVEVLAARLEELAQSWGELTGAERMRKYVRGVHDLIIGKAVETAMEFALTGGAPK